MACEMLSVDKGHVAPDLSQADADCAAMVAERNLGEVFLDNASKLAIVEALQKLTHVKLDREKLVSLDSCQYFLAFPRLTNLYLQENNLNSLKGLEIARNLKFLTVAGNQITKLEGLSSLSQLMVLDVSYNEILEIDAERELPKSLRFLNIVGNPCWQHQCDLRAQLKIALPNLKEIDGLALTDEECTSEYESLENSEDSDLDDQRSHADENNDKLTCHEDQERNQQTPSDHSLIFAKEICRTSPILQQIQTPSAFKTLPTHVTSLEIPDSKSIDSQLEAGSKDADDLEECLYKANVEPEFALQKILAMTTGILDYPTIAITERIADRVNKLDGQISEEIVDLFFSPRSSPKLAFEMTNRIEDCESPPQSQKEPRNN